MSSQQNKIVRIAISEELVQENQLDKFIKYSGVRIVLLSDKPSSIENLKSLSELYKKFRNVHSIRLAGIVPNISQIDVLFMKKEKFDYCRELAKSAENLAWKRKIFVYKPLDSEETAIFEDFFCYCGWQYFSEYIREFLNVPTKEKKITKTHKRDEPDYKKIQAEPNENEVNPDEFQVPEDYVPPEDQPF